MGSLSCHLRVLMALLGELDPYKLPSKQSLTCLHRISLKIAEDRTIKNVLRSTKDDRKLCPSVVDSVYIYLKRQISI